MMYTGMYIHVQYMCTLYFISLTPLHFRYAFGIIICCLALLTFVLTIVGIVLGVLGWRKDRSPDSRTKISHCGGIILLMWGKCLLLCVSTICVHVNFKFLLHSTVYLTFLFGFVLLILAALAFFFGSNLQKICQAIEPPEYEVFTKVSLLLGRPRVEC